MAIDVEALRDELELACLDAMGGDPPGPLMAARLQRTCIALLRRHRLAAARVEARSGPAGTAVRVTLPPGAARVRQLVLTLGVR